MAMDRAYVQRKQGQRFLGRERIECRPLTGGAYQNDSDTLLGVVEALNQNSVELTLSVSTASVLSRKIQPP